MGSKGKSADSGCALQFLRDKMFSKLRSIDCENEQSLHFSKTGGPLNLPRYLQHGIMGMQCNSAHVSGQLINLCFSNLKFPRRVNLTRNRRNMKKIIKYNYIILYIYKRNNKKT